MSRSTRPGPNSGLPTSPTHHIYGGRFRLEKKVDQTFDVYGEYTGVYEDFRGITTSTSSVDRTGGRQDVRLGVNWF